MTYPTDRPGQVAGAAAFGITMAVIEFLFAPFQGIMHGGLVESMPDLVAYLIVGEMAGAVLLFVASVVVLRRRGWAFYVVAACWHLAMCVPYVVVGAVSGLVLAPLPLVGLVLITPSRVRRWYG
ncbi:hypothetical protein GCM10029964_099450 [Kibdelosporangium lantanae]